MFDEREIERLLNRAIERRIREILELESTPAEERPEPQIFRAKVTAFRDKLAVFRLAKRKTGWRRWAWEWAKALGMILGPGMVFAFLLSSAVHKWVSAALPSVLIYLSLLWR